MSIQHKAQVLIISCIDFRFQSQIEEDLSKRNLSGKFDRISWPGASKDLEKVKQAACISIRLHDPDEAFIYEHEDCGAYGEDNLPQTHKTNAQKLGKALKQIKPKIEVNTLIATSKGIKEL